jgi:hypothetical protein
MPTFLQPVLVPDRCYLFEALLWVAFQRLPVFSSDHEGVDIRKSDEMRESGAAGYAVDLPIQFATKFELDQRFQSSNHIMRPCRACTSRCERRDRR